MSDSDYPDQPPASPEGFPTIHARVVAADPRNGLGAQFRDDWDYVIDHREQGEMRSANGWAPIADIVGSRGDDMVMFGRPKVTPVAPPKGARP